MMLQRLARRLGIYERDKCTEHDAVQSLKRARKEYKLASKDSANWRGLTSTGASTGRDEDQGAGRSATSKAISDSSVAYGEPKIMAPAVRACLRASGMAANLSKDVFFGPKLYQGLGMQHPFYLQGI